MLIIESFFQAIASIKQNKMRSILTMIGIIIGIAAVISIRMMGNSMSDIITHQLSEIGLNNIYLGLEPRQTEDGSERPMRGPGITREIAQDDYYSDDMLDDLRNHFQDEKKGISYSEIASQNSKIIKDSNYAVVTVKGVNYDYMEYTNESTLFQKGLIAGSKISKRAMDEGRTEIIISDKVCNNIFPKLTYDEVIGQEIEVPVGKGSYTFHIKGIYETNPAYYDGLYDDETQAYIAIEYIKKKFHEKGVEQVEIIVNEENVTSIDDFSDDVENYMDKYYHNNKYWDTSTFTMNSYAEETTGMINAISIVLIVVAGIALLVGGIGVMNIMFVSVSERTKEIGIRKSLGASNAAIQLQFVIESIVLSIMGGIVGILIGRGIGEIAVSVIMPKLSENIVVSPRLDLTSVIISVGFSVAIGVFFGYYPATKAAKLNPIDALRE